MRSLLKYSLCLLLLGLFMPMQVYAVNHDIHCTGSEQKCDGTGKTSSSSPESCGECEDNTSSETSGVSADNSVVDYLKNNLWIFVPVKKYSFSNEKASLSLYWSNKYNGPKVNNPFSGNWTLSNLYYLKKTGNGKTIIFCTPNGKDIIFDVDENGNYVGRPDGAAVLKKSGNGYILEGITGIRYSFTDFVLNERRAMFACCTSIRNRSYKVPVNFEYDKSYKLQSIKFGNDTLLYKFTYEDNHITHIHDGLNNSLVTLKYNDLNWLNEINYGEYAGQKNYHYAFEYGDGAKLIKKIRPNGGVVEYTYKGELLTQVKDALGHELKISHSGNVITIVNKRGNTLKYTLEPTTGEYTKLEFANGDKIERKLNSKGLVTEKAGSCKSCDGGGADNIQNIYNDKGWLLERQWLAHGKVEATEKYERDSRGRIITRTNKKGDVTRYKYDMYNNLIETVYPDKSSVKTIYDANGKLLAEVDELGRTTKTAYTDMGQIKKVTYPDGTYTENYYNEIAQLIGQRRRDGRIAYIKYDRLGMLVAKTPYIGNENPNELAPLDAAKELYEKGNFRQWDHDIQGNILASRDYNSNTVKNEYDLQWRLKKSVYPDNTYVEYWRDGAGNETKRRNRNGTYNFAEYNVRGSIVKSIFDDGDKIGEIDPKDTFIKYMYNAENQMIAQVDRKGNISEYQRDFMNRSMTDINALDQKTVRENDISGRLAKYIDAAGNVTSYDYDIRGWLSSITRPDGSKTTYEYDKAGKRIRTIDPNGMTRETLYDKGGRVLKEIADAKNSKVTTAYEYDKLGTLVKLIADEGHSNITTTYRYDIFGRVASSTTPDGITQSRVYDNNGNVIEMTVSAGNLKSTTRSVYDNMNRVIKTISPSGVQQINLYDNLGQLVQRKITGDGSNGYAQGYRYEEKTGRLVAKISNPGTKEEVETLQRYDANGNVTAIVGPDGGMQQFKYDPLGRKIASIDALGNTSRIEYAENNASVTALDPNGRSTLTKYDNMGRVTEQLNEMGQPVKYTYDISGNRLTLTDANDNTSKWNYDIFGRPTSLIYPNGDKETYSYDRLGRVTTKTKPDGTKLAFIYDTGSRVTLLRTPQGTLTFKYDMLGRLIDEIDNTLPEGKNGRVTYKYNDLGQLIAKTDHNVNQTIKYEYNKLVQRVKMTVGDKSVSYTYDLNGQLATVKKNDEKSPSTYSYDKSGRRTSISLPNGVVTKYTYDKAGRLLAVISKDKAGKVISGTEYTLDKTGNRTGMKLTLESDKKSTVQIIKYQFDNAYRLTRETRYNVINPDAKGQGLGQPIYEESYTYDALGNRIARLSFDGNKYIKTEYTYNNANQLLSEITDGKTKTYTYDKNGNTVSITGADSKVTMTYDWLNRQTSWSDGKSTEKQVYRGAAWKRIETVTVENGKTESVKYLYDDDNVVCDFDSENKEVAFYVTPFLDQNISVTRYDNVKASVTNGGALSSVGDDASKGKTYYYTADGLGSIRTLTDASGEVMNSNDYYAFGGVNSKLTKSKVANRYTYTGRENSLLASAENSPMYYRWRMYGTGVGRFEKRDPDDYDSNLNGNLFQYVYGRPSQYNDPSGLYTTTDTIGWKTKNPNWIKIKSRADISRKYLSHSYMLSVEYDMNCECVDGYNISHIIIQNIKGYSSKPIGHFNLLFVNIGLDQEYVSYYADSYSKPCKDGSGNVGYIDIHWFIYKSSWIGVGEIGIGLAVSIKALEEAKYTLQNKVIGDSMLRITNSRCCKQN